MIACKVNGKSRRLNVHPMKRVLDVLRGVAASGRASEIALYTGNDDNIVADLLTDYRAGGASRLVPQG